VKLSVRLHYLGSNAPEEIGCGDVGTLVDGGKTFAVHKASLTFVVAWFGRISVSDNDPSFLLLLSAFAIWQC